MANIYKFTVRLAEGHDPTPAGVRSQLGLSDLHRWRDVYVETGGTLEEKQRESLRGALGNGLTEQVELGRPLQAGRQVQVAYKRGIVDNEND